MRHKRWKRTVHSVQFRALPLVLIALGLGVLGWAGAIIAAVIDSHQFYRAYLFAYVFWMQIPIGSMAILSIHYLGGGKWGELVIRQLRASVMTLPVIAVLFVPIFAGMSVIYPWLSPSYSAVTHYYAHFKEGYLTQWIYWARTAFYFFCWLVFGWFLLYSKGSALRKWSAATLIMLFITITFSSIDWIMSIEPDWYSTSYGPILMLSDTMTAQAFALFSLMLFVDPLRIRDKLHPKPLNDAGNFLLVSMLGWIYLSFMQYLIIWSGNLPDETTWYLRRTNAGWKWVLVSIVICSAGLPFFALLFRAVKTNLGNIGALAGVLVFFRIVWSYWYVIPAYHPSGFTINWEDFAVFFAIGGVWCAAYLLALFSPLTATLIAGEESSLPLATLRETEASLASQNHSS